MSAIQEVKDIARGFEGSGGKVTLNARHVAACGKQLKGRELPNGGMEVAAADLCKLARRLRETGDDDAPEEPEAKGGGSGGGK